MTDLPPAGWHRDPSDPERSLRWWDGSGWTGHTQPATPRQPAAYGAADSASWAGAQQGASGWPPQSPQAGPDAWTPQGGPLQPGAGPWTPQGGPLQPGPDPWTPQGGPLQPGPDPWTPQGRSAHTGAGPWVPQGGPARPGWGPAAGYGPGTAGGAGAGFGTPAGMTTARGNLSLAARNRLSFTTMGVVAVYVVVALSSHIVFLGIAPALLSLRALRRREPLAPLAIVAAGIAIVVAVIALSHH